MSENKSIVILGGGQMGSGIAQVAIANGYQAVVVEKSEAGLERGLNRIQKNLQRLVDRERISAEDRDAQLALFSNTTDWDVFKTADFAIEAVSENTDLKFEVFERFDEICPENAILATNTSSISITQIASRTKRPESVIGMHFMNPVPVMNLVEIIRGIATSDDTHTRTCDLARALGKTVVTARDYPGFLVNRILIPMINEACFALMEGVGTEEDIDNAMTLGCNQPMGPLRLADLIGLDTVLAILEVLHHDFGDQKYRPCPLLKRYVDAGYLGRKTGRGFYTY